MIKESSPPPTKEGGNAGFVEIIISRESKENVVRGWLGKRRLCAVTNQCVMLLYKIVLSPDISGRWFGDSVSDSTDRPLPLPMHERRVRSPSRQERTLLLLRLNSLSILNSNEEADLAIFRPSGLCAFRLFRSRSSEKIESHLSPELFPKRG